MSFEYEVCGGDVVVRGLCDFSLTQTFDCGQCFRFEPTGPDSVAGVAHGRYIEFCQPDEGTLIIKNVSEEEFRKVWRGYLSLDDDYSTIKKSVSECFSEGCGSVIDRAIALGGGIRILHQEPWETLCSFIVSQNNNIPRIKKIIRAMCERYGEPVRTPDGGTEYTFPSPEKLYSAGEQELYGLRTGFRAKYIYDAARRVSCGETDLSAIAAADTADALAALCEIKGVGMKVASCALLFGFGKTDVFPIDVWIKRIVAKYYPDGLDLSALGDYAGIGQQYLFYYVRYVNPNLE